MESDLLYVDYYLGWQPDMMTYYNRITAFFRRGLFWDGTFPPLKDLPPSIFNTTDLPELPVVSKIELQFGTKSLH